MMFFKIILTINTLHFHFFFCMLLTVRSNYDKLVASINEQGTRYKGTLAQVVEHRPFKAGVAGSSPARLKIPARSSIG